MQMMNLPPLTVRERSYSRLNQRFVVVLPDTGRYVSFENWEQVTRYYRRAARGMNVEIFGARFFEFRSAGWEEVPSPSFR